MIFADRLKNLLETKKLHEFAFFSVLYFYLLSFFPVSLIFSDTIVTGGDTASHFSAADYLVKYLLPQGKIIGWYPGNYGGFPVFIYYFPPLYLLTTILHLVLPLTVSFKIATLIGPLLLPICSYLMVRLFRMPFPAPLFAAASSLLFLFNSSNSMWGGNIYSTLAGEFSYAAGFSFTFLFFGLLFDLIEKIKSSPNKLHIKETILSSLVFCLVGLSHGFTLVICVVSSLFFLCYKDFFLKKIFYIILVLAAGSLLFAWWFIPLFLNLPYTTQFEFSWIFTSFHELLPPILIPGLILFSIYSVIIIFSTILPIPNISPLERRAAMFSWFIITICMLAFFNSDKLRLPDIRFIPFIQYLVTVIGFSALGRAISKNSETCINCSIAFPALMLLSSYLLIEDDFRTNPNKWTPKDWIKWNYQGYEQAPQWNTFNAINNFLKGSFQNPRVVFEHNDNINGMGSTRAFENLPHFAKRATLEGLYFQSSLLSPFVFYLQSLYSSQISCPFPEYPCSQLNLLRAHSYLKLMNVNQLILQTDASKNQARALTDLYELQHSISETPYEIWKLKGESQYIEVLNREPEYIAPDNFRYDFYNWFTTYHYGKKLLYTLPNKYRYIYGLNSLPKHYKSHEKTNDKSCVVTEKIENEAISFTTTCPGRPHLIKFAYNPGWKVAGAIGPYLASPAFMLVYPTDNTVRLEYKNKTPKTLGQIFTICGGLLVILLIYITQSTTAGNIFLSFIEVISNNSLSNKFRLLFIVSLIIFIAFAIKIISHATYSGSFAKAERLYTKSKHEKAQVALKEIIKNWPDEPSVGKVHYYLALSYSMNNKYEDALEEFSTLADIPFGQYATEANYNVGLCLQKLGRNEEARTKYQKLATELPDSIWGKYSVDRLKELETVIQ